MGPKYRLVMTVLRTRIQLFMTIQRMGPEYRMFIDSARDQNIRWFMTVHGEQQTVHTGKVYDSAKDQNTECLLTVHGTRIQNVY